MKYENFMQIYSVSQKDYMSFSRDFLMQIVCQTENSQSPIFHDCGILILNTVCYFFWVERRKKTEAAIVCMQFYTNLSIIVISTYCYFNVFVLQAEHKSL